MKTSREIPGPKEYCELRLATGLSPKNERVAETALSKSLFAVCVRKGPTLVGMGRVVGDGLHVQVVDIAVHPTLQGKGIGRLIMEEVMGFIRNSLDPTATVSLFADNDWLYQKFGFEKPAHSQGMLLKKAL